MHTLRRFTLAFAAAAVALASGCSSSDSTGPSAPLPVLGLTATATGSATTRVTFGGRASESYEIERAEGAAGTFAVVNTVTTVATDGTQTFNDAGLKVSTVYRYRVTSVKGTLRSSPTSEVSVTTLAFGSAAATITTDILASRTLYADTASR